MKLGLLRVGQVPVGVTKQIQENLLQVFPNTTCLIIDEELPLPRKAFDGKRGQYRSSIILNEIQRYTAKRKDFDSVLGVVDADIFVSGLNFVFGEAACPGKAALISLWRLRPEFYGALADMEVFLERSVKEAVHEVGHTLGLRHCGRFSCVMFFSNSIVDTDGKQSQFCDQCTAKVAFNVRHLGVSC
jgi:archaemetzincin